MNYWNIIGSQYCRKMILIKHMNIFWISLDYYMTKNCPLKLFSHKNKYSEAPWITKGLQHACKKKNKLYRDFMKHRSLDVENKYKKYKNKLTAILRIAQQDYYSKLFDRNKKNIKGIWNVFNNIIKKNSGKISFPPFFFYK